MNKYRFDKQSAITSLVSAFILMLLSTQVLADAGDLGKKLTFGIVPQQSATKLAQLWTPIIESLSEATGYDIKFATAPNIPEFEKRLAAGEYDLAYMNPYHYTIFNQNPGYQAFAKAKDKKLVGIIVVRRDSPYTELGQLSGQTLAFPSPAAFAASIVTRSVMHSASIPFEAAYVSSHDSVYRSVAKGIYPAGGGVVRTLDNTEESIREQLRILWTSPGYTPHAFAAHPRLDPAVIDSIQSSMVQLDETEYGKNLLASLRIKGIATARNEDWDDIRAMNIQELISFTDPQGR